MYSTNSLELKKYVELLDKLDSNLEKVWHDIREYDIRKLPKPKFTGKASKERNLVVQEPLNFSEARLKACKYDILLAGVTVHACDLFQLYIGNERVPDEEKKLKTIRSEVLRDVTNSDYTKDLLEKKLKPDTEYSYDVVAVYDLLEKSLNLLQDVVSKLGKMIYKAKEKFNEVKDKYGMGSRLKGTLDNLLGQGLSISARKQLFEIGNTNQNLINFISKMVLTAAQNIIQAATDYRKMAYGDTEYGD